MNAARIKKVELGFLEHVGSASIARYPDRGPFLDWTKITVRWQDQRNEKQINFAIEKLWAKYYGHNEYTQVFESKPDKIQIIMIVYCEENISLKIGKHDSEVNVGDIIAIDPGQNIKATGNFIIAKRNFKEHEVPKVEKARRLFLKDLQKISKHMKQMER